ncbi:13422_t:CDS:2 [Ambispora gerdemannii]|uniref:13422_t:CDS:1 n=1 Tax=Ambispora gerdemannii TaxID=144530 RepID=A0A9N9BHQ9_9GLOM|nr:13422_t:CDS:2 [Ambispora gerdemannii]
MSERQTSDQQDLLPSRTTAASRYRRGGRARGRGNNFRGRGGNGGHRSLSNSRILNENNNIENDPAFRRNNKPSHNSDEQSRSRRNRDNVERSQQQAENAESNDPAASSNISNSSTGDLSKFGQQKNTQEISQSDHTEQEQPETSSNHNNSNNSRPRYRRRNNQTRNNRIESANSEAVGGQQLSANVKGKAREVQSSSSNDFASNSKSSRPKYKYLGSHSKRATIMQMSQNEITDVLTSITHGLTTSTYECVICFEFIRLSHRTWSCNVCWVVLHLHCTEKWAKKSITESKNTDNIWGCPGCRSDYYFIPREYWCFCGKTRDPEINRYLTPHTCGQICKKSRDCPHDCTLQCHPGPCPPCSAMGPKTTCWCGLQTFQKRCVDTDYTEKLSCGEKCGQVLECGSHYCQRPCHGDPCNTCTEIETQLCYCGKNERVANCGDGNVFRSTSNREGDREYWIGHFECETLCDGLLECGKHRCERICHPVDRKLESCPYDPSRVETCPCGENSIISLLGQQRTSCTDEIPTCNNKCPKLLQCGHACQYNCHQGGCSTCEVILQVQCRCGSTTFQRKCSEINRESDELPTCDKICQGLRSCGKHRCNVRCCPSANKPRKKIMFGQEPEEEDENHRCTFVCDKKLKCGNHNCQLPCHRGHCLPCLEASFEELTCHCGRTKVFPPISCGMTIPPCPYTCIREPPCGHAGVTHPCHTDSQTCPPCPYFVEKMCMCGRSAIKNVPCHKSNVSCGRICDRIAPCGGHRCKRTCHSGDCLTNEQGVTGKCTQPCGKPRNICGHPCTALCHAPARCPEDIPCQQKITLSCKCGNLKQDVTCFMSSHNSTENKNRVLQCTDYCAMLERNRRLAQALEIETGEGSGLKYVPKYPEDLLKYYTAHKDWAKNIETQINEFMKSDKQTLDLKPMKAPHRQFIHELCAVYRLHSESFDEEPYRSVYIKKKIDSIMQTVANNVSASGSSTLPSTISPSASSSALEQLVRKPKQPVNGLYLAELEFGITREELQKEIEPIMGRFKFVVKWVAEEDAVIMPFVGSMQMDELEILLMRLKYSAKDALVPKAICAWVELCWVNSKFEVVWRERGKLINNLGNVSGLGSGSDAEAKSPLVMMPSRPPIGNTNPFEILSSENNSSANLKQATPRPLSNVWMSRRQQHQQSVAPSSSSSRQVKPSQNYSKGFFAGSEDDVPDDWEMLSDV